MPELKILVIAQSVDSGDPLLGFFSGWLQAWARGVDEISVLARNAAADGLPDNIKLFSFCSRNRLMRIIKFNFLANKIILNQKPDIIFIHMCPEYALAVFPCAKIKNIPMVMWYAHGHTGIKLRLAHFFLDRVVTASAESCRLRSNKTVIAGHGIDMGKFKILDRPEAGGNLIQNGAKVILSAGRISPIKRYDLLIQALNILVNRKDMRGIKLRIAGGVPKKSQDGYLLSLKALVKQYKLEDHVEFTGPAPYARMEHYYRDCDLFVSASETGSLDKAVLEAMACARPVLTSNQAFRGLLNGLAEEFIFREGDALSLAERIIYFLKMDDPERDALSLRLREAILKAHTLGHLTDNLMAIFRNTRKSHVSK